MRMIAVIAAAPCLAIAVSAMAVEQRTSSPTTVAASANPTMQERFRRLDANADGVLTWDEARPAREAEFRRLDRNHDGVLTPNEFTDRSLPFAAFDANHDGEISLSEYLAKHQEMFQRADTDHDGTVSLAEFVKAQQALGRASGRSIAPNQR